jgi:hypothetical protein
MLFQRKIFVDTIKSMPSRDGKLFFRDSDEKGAFEVICIKKSRFYNTVLMKAVFQTEDFGIFSDDAGVIGEPFFVDAQDVLSALSGKDAFAEYKDGLFDGVSVGCSVISNLSQERSYNKYDLRKHLNYFGALKKPNLKITIPAEEHRIITRNIKNFSSDDQIRSFMNSICFHFNAPGNIRVVATDGRSLAVYRIPGAFDDELSGLWTISPEMLFAPAYNYENAVFSFSKEMVSATVYGAPDNPVITTYDIAQEWRSLKDIRDNYKGFVLDGLKTQKEADEAEKMRLEEGPDTVFPNYERVIPQNNTEKMVLDREEIGLGLEKLKRLLYKPFCDNRKVFIINALDPKNIFLTSATDIDNSRISFINTSLPLKKATVSCAVRVAFSQSCFEKCCLDGNSKVELAFRNSKGVFMTEGVDFYKNHSVDVTKIFTTFSLPETFNEYGEAPTPVSAPEEESGNEDSED